MRLHQPGSSPLEPGRQVPNPVRQPVKKPQPVKTPVTEPS